jgi:hypothetical protein
VLVSIVHIPQKLNPTSSQASFNAYNLARYRKHGLRRLRVIFGSPLSSLRPFRHRLTYYRHLLHVQLINEGAKVADVARGAFLQEGHNIFLVERRETQ